MFKYAQLKDDVVIGISYLSGEVDADNMVLINDLEVEMGSNYDPSTQMFTPPESKPEPEPKASLEEMTEENLLEAKYQTFLLEMMI